MNTYQIKLDMRPNGQKYQDWDTLSLVDVLNKFMVIFDILVPPMVVGLYGEWGSGKTEMIKAISEELDSKKFITHIFDAWKFRKEENIILPLLQNIANEHKTISEVQKSAKKIITATTFIALNQIAKNMVGINLGDVKKELKYAEKRQKHYENFINKTNGIEGEFNSLIQEIAKNDKKFIIFIDNLDRCLPEHVLNLLEDIANFLHSEKCIFVLSMDKSVVVQAIQEKYRNFSGQGYLDKIVQVGLKIPVPEIDEHGESRAIYHFMKRYECAKGYMKRSEIRNNRGIIHKKLNSTLSLLFSEGFLNNLRRIEKYVNKFIVLERMNILNIEQKPDNAPFVILMLVFKEQFPDAYTAVIDSADLRTLNNLMNYAVLPEKSPNRLKQKQEHGLQIFNDFLFEKYKNDHDFYNFLKLLHRVATETGKFPDANKFESQFEEAKKVISMID